MDAWTGLLDSLVKLQQSWPGTAWSWDDRFQAIASPFTIDLEPKARTSAQHAFPRGWTSKSLDAAPPAHRAICDKTGGLRAGQRLLGGDIATAATLFGLWWPWGGGDKVTLRIGLLDTTAKLEPMPQILALFGIAPR